MEIKKTYIDILDRKSDRISFQPKVEIWMHRSEDTYCS